MTRPLDESEYLATMTAPMADVTSTEEAAVDIWAYVEAITRDDLEGRTPHNGRVDGVYRNAPGTFEHVLVPTDVKNVYLVVIVNLAARSVHGHRLLDLNEKYGVAPTADG